MGSVTEKQLAGLVFLKPPPLGDGTGGCGGWHGVRTVPTGKLPGLVEHNAANETALLAEKSVTKSY